MYTRKIWKVCIVLSQTSLYLLILSSRKRNLRLWGQKMTSCQKITSCYGSVHSANDICVFACKMETKTMLVHKTISELNFEHNILPIIFHILTKNAQMR